MKKGLITAGLVAAVVVVVLLVSGGGSGSGYEVRAIFDSGGFMVKGEEVRVAGANVGEIESVDVTQPGETVSYTADGKPVAKPAKAVIVMKIVDPGFQDFRSDASCLIRPQSLIGEKFVDCRPTLPRAPGSDPAPPLKQIPDGQTGAGQYLLPLENNSTSVDPDLINDIQSLPYAQRFRIIINELGAGLAGRGKDIQAVVKRANPVLRDAVRLIGILRDQRRQLAQLAADSEQVLGPLSRERAHFAGFFSNAGATAQATAEKGPQLQAALAKFPEFLRQFRTTMTSLKGFSDAGAPVVSNLDAATPAFTEATRLLKPFSAASTVALKSLGATGEVAGPKFRAADPIVKKTRDLAQAAAHPTSQLAKFLVNTKKTGGFNALLSLIYNTTAVVNGYDKYGHFTRSAVLLTNCLDYRSTTGVGASGCAAQFNGPAVPASSAVTDPTAIYSAIQDELAQLQPTTSEGGGTSAPILDYLLGP